MKVITNTPPDSNVASHKLTELTSLQTDRGTILATVLLLAVWLFHPILLTSWGLGSVKSAAASISVGLLCAVLYLHAGRLPWIGLRRLFRGLFFFAGFAPMAAVVGYEVMEGLPFGAGAMVLIGQTNAGEAFHFLKSRPDYVAAFVLLLAIALSLPQWGAAERLSNSKWLKLMTAASLALVATCALTHCYKASDLRLSYRKARAIFKMPKGDARHLAAYRIELRQKLHIVVIGESSNRSHWSLYGYERETTPEMSAAIATCRHCAYSKGAWSADKFTTTALKYALTDGNQYNGLNSKVDLVHVLKAAGFRTVWISNQEYVGAENQPYNKVGEAADETHFLDARVFSFHDDRPRDDKVVPTLKDVLAHTKTPTVVFIHLMGSHGPYAMRSAGKYVRWKQLKHPNSTDDYDNSILYTDHLLSELMSVGHDADSFLYFSDHGELPGVGRDHLDIEMFKIPLVAFFKAPTSRQKRFLQNLKNDVPFTNDGIYDTLLGIYGVRTSYYDESLDLSNEHYRFKHPEELLLNLGRNCLRGGRLQTHATGE